MRIKMCHTDIGHGELTTEHAASSNGVPVFVDLDGKAYGPGDKFPAYNCNTGYLHKIEGETYTPEDIQWVHDYIVRTHLDEFRTTNAPRWLFGATWKTAAQLAEIEQKNQRTMIRNH